MVQASQGSEASLFPKLFILMAIIFTVIPHIGLHCCQRYIPVEKDLITSLVNGC